MAKKFKFNFIKIFITLFCLGILFTVGREVFSRHFFNERMTVIPNVVNLNEKDEIKYLKEAGLKVKVIGVGRVKKQSLTSGQAFNKNQTIIIELS